jgi:hypothetical protein
MKMITCDGQESLQRALKKYGESLSGSFIRSNGTAYKIIFKGEKLLLSLNGKNYDISEIKGKKLCIFYNDGEDTFSYEEI